jgi:hypothetical protein
VIAFDYFLVFFPSGIFLAWMGVSACVFWEDISPPLKRRRERKRLEKESYKG